MKKETIETVWEVREYDVWGNAKEGYEVNDSWVTDREYPMTLNVETNNKGTGGEFKSAYPTDSQIRKAFGLSRLQIQLDGDDLSIFVNRKRDDRPIGVLNCISHKSLSPVQLAD